MQFVGEEGVDEGGLQKEFFQLFVREMFNEKYGMFKCNSESNFCWLNANATDDQSVLDEYKLIGMVIGLAIYNSVILDLNFPLALYKKLLGYPTSYDDLCAYDPSLGRTLSNILKTENIEESGITFQITIDVLGEAVPYDLKPDGDNIPVTSENRQG